ncbi:PTS sugar transporter subunit IIA [Anaeromyxobacter sp. PSR-1]|uniref:PTS sugar transporter subunit IIA n=1 Tax=unclassified Anaeromyxobacter TaxID=2620896 RepID=UPI0005DED207|nr:PTS sugar transporter subunit IIA [Anaeromyxobacter sp. PSR-1]GAO05380.1 nitrogen regulatory protein [Anaeromyxobacter sp. PSR-1]
MQLTERDAARLLGVPEATLQRWLRSGELAASRVNEQYRLNKIDLLEFASSRGLEISPDLLAELEQPALPSLAEAIRAGGVHQGLAGADKAATLRDLVDRLALPREADRDLVHRMLLAREALGSTGVGNGIAIPHARNPIVLHVATPAVAISYLDRPVDFEALDGKPVHTLVLLVSPSTRAHLHLLALVATALRDPGVLSALDARAGVDALVPEIERVEAAIAEKRAAARKP